MIVRGISYAGCGFKGTYHFGATAALKDHLGLDSYKLFDNLHIPPVDPYKRF